MTENSTTPAGVTPYLKRLTLHFFAASVIYFLIAGALGIIMRMFQAGAFASAPVFYSAMTVHGQVMFFGFASMLSMGFSYYLIPKFMQKRLHSERLAAVSFWLMNAGLVGVIAAGAAGFGGGWYNLLPLAFYPAGVWDMSAAAVFLVGDTLIALGITVFCIEIILSVLTGAHKAGNPVAVGISPSARFLAGVGIDSWLPKRMRAHIAPIPIFVVAAFVNAVDQMIGNPFLLMQLGIAFGVLTAPGFTPDWLLAKNFFWMFGHPIVYFVLFPFLGLTYYYVALGAGRDLNTRYERWVHAPWPLYFVFTVTVFMHHIYMDMPQPFWMNMIGQTASLGIAVPSGITFFTVLVFLAMRRFKWSLPLRFMVIGVMGWVIGGFIGEQQGLWGLDVYLHNTLTVPSHFHLTILMGSMMMGFGGIYLLLEELTGRKYDRTLAEIHLWTTVIGGFGFSLGLGLLGYLGLPRREAFVPPVFPQDFFLSGLTWIFFFALVLGIGQVIFAYNFFRSMRASQAASKGLPPR